MSDLVCLTAVPDANDINDAATIVHGVHDPVVTDANPPKVARTAKLASARWSRVDGENVDLRDNPSDDRRIECFQFFAS